MKHDLRDSCRHALLFAAIACADASYARASAVGGQDEVHSLLGVRRLDPIRDACGTQETHLVLHRYRAEGVFDLGSAVSISDRGAGLVFDEFASLLSRVEDEESCGSCGAKVGNAWSELVEPWRSRRSWRPLSNVLRFRATSRSAPESSSWGQARAVLTLINNAALNDQLSPKYIAVISEKCAIRRDFELPYRLEGRDIVELDFLLDLRNPTQVDGHTIDIQFDNGQTWAVVPRVDESLVPFRCQAVDAEQGRASGNRRAAWSIESTGTCRVRLVSAPPCVDVALMSDGSRTVVELRESAVAQRFHDCAAAIVGIAVDGDSVEWQRKLVVRHSTPLHTASGARPLLTALAPGEVVAVFGSADSGAVALCYPDRLPWAASALLSHGYREIGRFDGGIQFQSTRRSVVFGSDRWELVQEITDAPDPARHDWSLMR